MTSTSVSDVNSAPSASELLLELHVVLDDPVDDDVDAVVGVEVRVRVLLGDAAVRGPAGVADAGGGRRRRDGDAAAVALGGRVDRGAQRAQVADGADRVEPALRLDRDARGVIPAVLELLETRRAGSPAPGAVRRSRRCRTWARPPFALLRSNRGRAAILDARVHSSSRDWTYAQASSASTSATRRAQTLSASSAVGASTITRTSGSVPLGRRSTRPRPSSAAASRSTAACTSVGGRRARRGRARAR